MKPGSLLVVLIFFVLAAGVFCTKHNTLTFQPPVPVKKTFQWGKEGSLLKVSSSIISNASTEELDWTTYEYDNHFNLVKATDSAQELTSDGYIIDGDAAEKRTVRVYEYSNNILVKIIYPDSLYPATSINYNMQGQLISAINTAKIFSFDYST